MIPLSELVAKVAPLVHADQKLLAAQVIGDSLPEPVVVSTAGEVDSLLHTLLDACLKRGEMELAAKLLWSPSFFTPDPRSVGMIWRNLRKYPKVLLPGGSSMGKTYTPGVLFYLEWLRDPEYTSVICVGPSEEHLTANLFSHLIKLHENAALPVPGKTGTLWIGLDSKNRRAGIRGVVIPVGKRAAGRVQGTKRHPRPVPSPTLGKLSRLFVLLDELENIPPGIYSDLENVSSQMGEEPDGFKLVGSYNPKDPTMRPYRMAEPLGGWENFDPEKDEEWDSKLGYRVVRLDAARSENVVTGKIVFSGLQTKSGFDETARTSGGIGSPGYWTFCRGCYPAAGSSTSCISSRLFDAAVAEVVFLESPASVGGVDPALEGGDGVQFCHLVYGRASGVKRGGVFFPFLSPSGMPNPRKVIEVRRMYGLAKGDSVAVAANIKAQAQILGVQAHCLLLDKTGVGSGPYDILRAWNPSVMGVGSMESATDTKVTEQDSQKASERFWRIHSELIFAARDWLEYGYCFLHPDFDMVPVRDQLADRKAYVDRGLQRAETKAEYKSRHAGRSPDEGDAFCLGIHAVRRAFSAVISMLHTVAAAEAAGDDREGYTDYSNQLDSLDD